MSWDEKARQNAVWCGYNSMVLGVAEAKGVQNTYSQGAKWQRDQIKECFKNHPDPQCEEHPDGDPISCGWKSAYISIMNYLEETE